MRYQPYPTKAAAPQRMGRKRSRRGVFEANRKAAKMARKARKKAREEALSYDAGDSGPNVGDE